LLFPGGEEDEDYDRQRSMAEKLKQITLPDGTPAIGEITAMVTTGKAALDYYTPQDVADLAGQNLLAVRLFFAANQFGESVRADRLLDAAAGLAEGNSEISQLREMLARARTSFQGPHYARMILETRFYSEEQGFNEAMERILEIAGEYWGDSYFITGAAMSNYDIGNAFTSDLLKVNLITLAAILLIVLFSFRNIRVSLLLVFVIEGAIWITMGISYLLGERIFFMAYLICLAIQMGATIDYGILLCDQYRTARKVIPDPQRAMGRAMRRSIPTILTSGTILTTAGYVIGLRCSVYYISAIGSLLSRGAFLSALLVLMLLPALLLLTDRESKNRRT